MEILVRYTVFEKWIQDKTKCKNYSSDVDAQIEPAPPICTANNHVHGDLEFALSFVYFSGLVVLSSKEGSIIKALLPP